MEGRLPGGLFTNVVIWNELGRTADCLERTVSLNDAQMEVDGERRYRVVVAHRDPGVPNWLDTCGEPRAAVFWRFMLPSGPPQAPVCTVMPVERVAGGAQWAGTIGVMTNPAMFEPGSPDRGAFEIYNRLLKNRIVFLGTDVDDDIANYITAQLLYLEGEDTEKDIWLYINSPGGSVTSGMAIYDTMQFIAPDVGTICMGLGASMGQFLLCAGAPGKRYALPHARIMMHQPLGGVRGQASDIAIQAEQHAYVKTLLADRIAHHTGQPVDQVEADSDRDRWFTAEEAKQYGIIDHVIVKRGEML